MAEFYEATQAARGRQPQEGGPSPRVDGASRQLAPVLARIAATDALIDQIVYRLYGLTEAEIAVVEGGG